MILHSHPTGNANSRQTLQGLVEGDLLTEFWTCIEWKPESFTARVAPGSLKRQFERRQFPETGGKIRTYPWREAGRLFAERAGWSKLTRHESGPLCVDAIFQTLDRRVAARIPQLPQLRGVYAGEDGALDTFKQARRHGLGTYYDLPIGYWKAAHEIYAEEKEREPEWAGTLKGSRDSAAKLARKDEELSLADIVFVASSFTESTLRYADSLPRVEKVRYGAPPAVDEKELSLETSKKLRLLYVGSLGQRKGISYLLKAVEALGSNVELTIIGGKPAAECAPLERGLKMHRYIPSLPNWQVLEEMRRHDVFLFPSLFEGFGLVILEAMSQGLPVLATPHSAGPDIISEGEDGFIVPIRSSDAIVEKLSLLLERPQLLKDMRFAARNKAIACTWASYRQTQAQIIRSAIESQPARS